MFLFNSTVAAITQTYRLSITDTTHNQSYTINFPGTTTLLEVKVNVSDLTNIPVRNQSWIGWPSQVTDDVRFITFLPIFFFL